MRMNRPILAASALILHTGRILLVRSKTTQEEWGFPGGKQEKEETPQQAVRREVKEELGIDIQVGKELGSFISHNRKFEIKCFVAETRRFGLRVNRDEIIEVKWCTLRESLALNLTSTTREALEKFTAQHHRKDAALD